MDGLRASHFAIAALWPIYQAELAAGQTALKWDRWLDQILAFRPRQKPMARFVAFALADARMREKRAPETAVANRWAL